MVAIRTAKEFRAMSAEDLRENLIDLRKEEFEMRMKRGTGQLTDNARFKKIRREVARIKTVLNETQSSAANDQQVTNDE